MVNKKAVFIVAIIALVIVSLIFGIKIKKLNSDNYDVEDISEETNQNTSIEASNENTIEDADEENDNKTNKKESESEDNQTENDVLNNTTTDSKEDEDKNITNTTTNSSDEKDSSSKETKTKKNPEDIAISLARKKWGNTGQEVYFDVEDEMSKGVYLVSVRDENTTAEIVSYKVDINKKTVSEN